ncbi:hypothetical protein BGZ60DRAFT_377124 [Tricladium varicosporioides]|nr:hypothetical protein BGZ60DRAFT_377124 [Hymenoscyphus varicosporioides]
MLYVCLYDPSFPLFLTTTQWSNLVQILYGPCILAVKLSILLQYLRIFVPSRQSNKSMFIALSITFTAHLLFYTVDTFFQIFSCNPREKAWDRTIIHGRCFDLPATFVASGAVNVVSDFVLLVLPIYSVWCLKISTRQKVAISGVFATGLLVCVASIGRMIYIIILFRTKNQTRAIIPPGLCGLAEISLALICSCLPTCPMFYRVIRSQLSSLSLFGFRPFHNTHSSPPTINGTKVSRAEGKHQSVWAQSVLRTCDREERWRKEGGEGTYHELGDWQRTPKRGELVVTISSPGRGKDGDVKSCFSGLEGSERGMGIVQTVSVEIEEMEAKVMEGWEKRERSFYDSS